MLPFGFWSAVLASRALNLVCPVSHVTKSFENVGGLAEAKFAPDLCRSMTSERYSIVQCRNASTLRGRNPKLSVTLSLQAGKMASRFGSMVAIDPHRRLRSDYLGSLQEGVNVLIPSVVRLRGGFGKAEGNLKFPRHMGVTIPGKLKYKFVPFIWSYAERPSELEG